MKFKQYINESIDKKFEKAFNSWFKSSQKLCDDYAKKQGKIDNKNAYAQKLTVKKNKKYWKVITESLMGSNKSVWAFINTLNGDVLKPASFKAPAKNARGNIFDKFNGMGNMTAYGPEYMRNMK